MSTYFNKTRTSSSIPRRLLREGRIYLIPLFYLLKTSRLAREGIENSGSYRFADYIYEGIPRGRNVIGRFLDGVLLRMKSAKAMRSRYVFGKQELEQLILQAYEERRRIDVLAVPCGLARELFELAEELQERAPDVLRFVRFHGIDLDRDLVDRLQRKANAYTAQMRFSVGDALDQANYDGPYDAILSMGFTEFLPDHLVTEFLTVIRRVLSNDGTLVTCGLRKHRLSGFLLEQMAELKAVYRSSENLQRMISESGFDLLSSYNDDTRLQTIVVAQPVGCNEDTPVIARPANRKAVSLEPA